jgi:50S ribosomal subunit-associated GTPase HflX
VSAETGVGLDELGRRVLTILQGNMRAMTLLVPAGEGRLLAYIAEHTSVLEREYVEGSVRLRIVAAPREAAHIEAALAGSGP